MGPRRVEQAALFLRILARNACTPKAFAAVGRSPRDLGELRHHRRLTTSTHGVPSINPELKIRILDAKVTTVPNKYLDAQEASVRYSVLRPLHE